METTREKINKIIIKRYGNGSSTHAQTMFILFDSIKFKHQNPTLLYRIKRFLGFTVPYWPTKEERLLELLEKLEIQNPKPNFSFLHSDN